MRRRSNLRNSLTTPKVEHDDSINLDFNKFSITRTNNKIERLLPTGIIENFFNDVNQILDQTCSALTANCEQDEMNKLKVLFINKAKKYIDINVNNYPITEETQCYCGTPYSEFDEISSSSIECPNCSSKLPLTFFNTEKKRNLDIEDQLKKVKSTLNIYLNNVSLPFYNELEIKLDEYMLGYGFPTHEEAKTLPIVDGMREGTSMKVMWRALKDMGYSTYYDVSLPIAYNYWSINPPNIEYIREDFYDLFIKITLAYDSIPIEIRRRESRLPMSIILPYILTHLGVQIRISQFRIPDKEESRNELKRLLRLVSEKINIPYYEIF